ncbi:MAG: helix-turn-helix transcriptional regulator [Paludibacteraceae bacterium]|nr:helix-turn-helix transcriptional regulator [Paludibacteraceae bacterium]
MKQNNSLHPGMLPEMIRHNPDVFFSDDMVFFNGVRCLVSSPLIDKVRSPQYVEMGRLVRVTSGSAEFRINLLPFKHQAGDILIIPENNCFEVVSVSDDYDAQAVAFRDLPSSFLRCTLLRLSGEDFERIGDYLQLIWDVLHSATGSVHVVRHLMMALMEDLRLTENVLDSGTTAHKSRGEQLMQDFLELVAAHGTTERSISFYAEKTFLTPNHLSAIVKRQSGQTVMQWVNQRTLLEAKILLANTDSSIGEIASRLGFDEETSFCRFFKRETNCTPLEYRKKALFTQNR